MGGMQFTISCLGHSFIGRDADEEHWAGPYGLGWALADAQRITLGVDFWMRFIQIRTLFAALQLHLHPLLFIRSISAGTSLARMFMHASVFFALVLILYVAPCKIQSSG